MTAKAMRVDLGEAFTMNVNATEKTLTKRVAGFQAEFPPFCMIRRLVCGGNRTFANALNGNSAAT